MADDVISGVDAEGNALFRHTYAYDQDMTVTYFGQELPGYLHVYRAEDADAGLFTYFGFADDNLAETQHIEFRYGDTPENLNNCSEGKYAYWLASGILDGYVWDLAYLSPDAYYQFCLTGIYPLDIPVPKRLRMTRGSTPNLEV